MPNWKLAPCITQSDTLSNEIKQCREELELIYDKRTEDSIIRSRASSVEYGEKKYKVFS